jgi:hypothetical protein
MFRRAAESGHYRLSRDPAICRRCLELGSSDHVTLVKDSYDNMPRLS